MSIQSNQPASGATASAGPRPYVAPTVDPAPRKADNESKAQRSREPDSVARTRQMAAAMEKQLRAAERNLQFQVDDGTGIVVVRVVDSVSGDVIRQIPNEEFLRLARNFRALNSDVSCIVDECA